MLTVRADGVELFGMVRKVWAELVPPESWIIIVEPDQQSQGLLVNAAGATNALGLIECRVTPIKPYRSRPKSNVIVELLGQRVRIGGTWCDRDDDGYVRTAIEPISWIVIDRGLSVITEEHGFSQVLRDVDVFAFSDDGDDASVPHHREDRHVDVLIPFPPKPQSNAIPVFSECDDREPDEAVLYDYGTKPAQSFPIVRCRQRTISPTADGTALRVEIDTGTPAAGQGYYYAKLTLTFEEPFEKMCLPDVCRTDPGMSCQYTGEHRRTIVPPRLRSARVGDMLLGPAGGSGILGRLLGALQPPQRFDHTVLFVEDDGRTVRHCTASDDRAAEEEYLNGEITVDYVLGQKKFKLPILGLVGDVVRYGWPGTITQTLGEVTVTGRNRSNPKFSFATQYADLVALEQQKFPAPNNLLLWKLAPAERDKRTAFHDWEATLRSRGLHSADKRKWYSLNRLQRDPADRDDVGLLPPMLVKPQPILDATARPALREVAIAAIKLHAHYRFYAYSRSALSIDPAYVAPPPGDPIWRGPGSDWAAGTFGAMCSSFIWAAVQRANIELQRFNQPLIVLEGETDPTDQRPRSGDDGLYAYQQGERQDAGKELFGFMYDKVAGEVEAKVEDIPWPVDEVVGDTVDDVKHYFASVVANQMCNAFAADAVGDLTDTWTSSGAGVAVSPDDTIFNWDTLATGPNPPAHPAPDQRYVYGFRQPVVIPNPGWGSEPVYLLQPSKGDGTVRGHVVRSEFDGAPRQPVPGATVRFGCEVRSTDIEGFFEFANVNAGRYLLDATLMVFDPLLGVSLEWRTERADDLDIDLVAGDELYRELVLVAPPGLARNVQIELHADVVDRRVVGKDDWGHFDRNRTITLAIDPSESAFPATVPQDEKNTRLTDDSYRERTDPVGSGVVVKLDVKVSLREQQVPGQPRFDGSIVVDLHFRFEDEEEGEVNATYDKTNVVIGTNQKYGFTYDLVSDDSVPERASGTVTIRNLVAVLP